MYAFENAVLKNKIVFLAYERQLIPFYYFRIGLFVEKQWKTENF